MVKIIKPEPMDMSPADEYRIIVWSSDSGELDDHGAWNDIGEGPWGDPDSAIQFACNEVGCPWVVVNEVGDPIEFGDAHGMCRIEK